MNARPLLDQTRILLANPRGFCAGVDRAIEIVERALAIYGSPVYVRHEVVHNKTVVDGLRAKGAVFIEDIDEAPNGAILIFSAHGVSQEIRQQAQARACKVLDATCPLVTKVHLEVARYAKEGRETILIGHRGHPEVEGTLGQYDGSEGGSIYLVESVADVQKLAVRDPERLAFVTQTTLSVDDTGAIIDALRARFPGILGPRKNDICYATQNRQDSVKKLTPHCDLMLVVGSANSSNSNRLREIASQLGVEAYLIDGPEEIDDAWLEGKKAVGVTAGASAPESLVKQVVARLNTKGATIAEEYAGIREQVVFPLPKELRA
jgi:4-hydroxy-3-methylbut-2-en-1-yl diphosphate reductase